MSHSELTTKGPIKSAKVFLSMALLTTPNPNICGFRILIVFTCKAAPWFPCSAGRCRSSEGWRSWSSLCCCPCCVHKPHCHRAATKNYSIITITITRWSKKLCVVCCCKLNDKIILCLYVDSDKLADQQVVSNYSYFRCTVVYGGKMHVHQNGAPS